MGSQAYGLGVVAFTKDGSQVVCPGIAELCSSVKFSGSRVGSERQRQVNEGFSGTTHGMEFLLAQLGWSLECV